MLVYTATKSEFMDDVFANRIEGKILSAFERRLGHSTSKSEIQSWKNSMMYMRNILGDQDIPGNAGVAIEYRIPHSDKRIDFILTGQGESENDTAIIVELKQWTEAKMTKMDAIVSTRFAKGDHETHHPSYQAWTYAAQLEDYNETVQKEAIRLKPCAYLHNCISGQVINNPFYREHTQKAPAFLKHDAKRLQDFIKQYVKHGDSRNIMYRIDNGKIKPSKNLADTLASLLQGNQEFLMIDDQKLVYETALYRAEIAKAKNKQVLIVEGGPGTGKSVVAINLLVEMTKRGKVVQYVTKNAAPRTVYESKLAGTMKKTRISNLFKGSGAYSESEANTFDALIVDEAHRLNEKSGMFRNKGENQIKEIIQAARCSVFFLDEDQRVTYKDIGEKGEIRKWAKKLGARVQELELLSQFRCNGSDGYLAWVDNALQLRETANETLEGIHYDFRVFDSPNKLREAIFKKNRINNKARLVAGYCWDWISKNNAGSSQMDIVLKEHDFSMQWNLSDDGSLWILKPETVNQIGCIHTCQGLEVDYIGVIVGPDLIVRNNQVHVQPEKRSKNDQSIKGYMKHLKENPEQAKAKAELIIKNTYRTLMTRGAKGCYLFSTDPETNKYFKGIVGNNNEQSTEIQETEKYPGLHLRLLSPEEARPFKNAVPVYDLQAAAGQFSGPQWVDEVTGANLPNAENYDWVELPDTYRIQPGLFVAQVIGESMNRRVPNGAWCLFKLNPGGTRQGKVVLAQHRDIQDTDTGAQYTVKVYESEKTKNEDGGWEHSRITLRPDSNEPEYKQITFDADSAEELKVIAEMVAVL